MTQSDSLETDPSQSHPASAQADAGAGADDHGSDEDLRRACDQARAAVAADPRDPDAAARLSEAIQLHARSGSRKASGSLPIPPPVEEARKLIVAGSLEEAEVILRHHLQVVRNEQSAMHSMGEIAAMCGFREDAERIFSRSAEIHAGSAEAWADLGMTLHRVACQKDYPEFIFESVNALDEALRLHPGLEGVLAYKAAILVQTRALDRGIATYEELLSLRPHSSAYWTNYAYLLKTVGEFGRGVAAYRTAVTVDPGNGSAWWGLANLKLARFFPADIALMEEGLAGSEVSETARIEINFALAKAHDQARNYEEAGRRLAEGNALRRAAQLPEEALATGDFGFVSRVFTRKFFASHKNWGNPSPGPIFILGMPRAGSTLIEQILASHPAIEGTEELFVLLQLAGELSRAQPGIPAARLYKDLSRQAAHDLGSRYLEVAGRSRTGDRPFFTDKNPYNWRYIGLIHCILPNARIIDARRNPLDCCFANYSQHYQAGANFSYDLHTLGNFYTDYIRTMRHFDEVLPGRIHRVIHEDLVDDFEPEVRRLLDYVGVPFDEACLKFYETERPVHTPSSEQVRQPINRSGFDKWRNYEPQLGPLIEALGDLPQTYRE
ncbi:MAG: sulfotransferase family protein [Alphaproteobacteria bacterium]|nr:sulfotransferase family protein [Alphaproteobacteria bacterium]